MARPGRTPPHLVVHHVHDEPHGAAGRAFRVWLPAGYADDPARRFPVLYLQDGQNVFDDATAATGRSWRAGDRVQRMIDQRRLPPLLLVGVDNSGPHRTDDYTPVPHHGRGGRAAALGRLLIDVIKPFVDARYRTLPDREHTAIAGSSLGGLFALHLALTRPDVFSRIAALSPTAWWGGAALHRTIDGLPARPGVRIWIDAGKREAPVLRQSVQALRNALLAKGWTEHRTAARANLRHAEPVRGRHDEASWGVRFGRALCFLFPAPSRSRRRRS